MIPILLVSALLAAKPGRAVPRKEAPMEFRILTDLPGTARSLAEDQPRTAELPGGARQGKNSWGRLGWNGPSPPPGRPHRYVFRLLALSAPLGLPAGATRTQVEAALGGKVLAEATWVGIYGR